MNLFYQYPHLRVVSKNIIKQCVFKLKQNNHVSRQIVKLYLTSPVLTSSAIIMTNPGGTLVLDTDTRAAREQWPQVSSYKGAISMMSSRDKLLNKQYVLPLKSLQL